MIGYDLLARSPSSYEGRLVSFRGKVIQATQSGLSYVLRVNVSRGKYDIWNDTIYVDYRAGSAADPRIHLMQRTKSGPGCRRGGASRAGLSWLVLSHWGSVTVIGVGERSTGRSCTSPGARGAGGCRLTGLTSPEGR